MGWYIRAILIGGGRSLGYKLAGYPVPKEELDQEARSINHYPECFFPILHIHLAVIS